MATQTGSIDLKAAKKAHDDAEKVATNYVADISNGILVHPDNDNTNGVQITNKVDIIRNSASVAEFGTSARIGENASGKSRTEIGTAGMQIYQNVNGTDTQIANLGYGPGEDEQGSTSNAPYYTLGLRDGAVGNYSVSEGDTTIASAYCSHSEGYHTQAIDRGAHAEGARTVASGTDAHAEGRWTTASGTDSHAQNYRTIAGYEYQTAIGKYNDNKSTNVFEIGNGTASNARSNALTVDWSGRVQCGDYSGTLTSIFDLFYPVGSYYETSDTSFDPNVTWGGTWSLETEGQVHIGAGSHYTVGATGGAKEVTLDATQIPSHNHVVNYVNYNRGSGSNATMGYLSSSAQSNHANTENTGGGQPHENMPPYIVVNRWHRTA